VVLEDDQAVLAGVGDGQPAVRHESELRGIAEGLRGALGEHGGCRAASQRAVGLPLGDELGDQLVEVAACPSPERLPAMRPWVSSTIRVGQARAPYSLQVRRSGSSITGWVTSYRSMFAASASWSFLHSNFGEWTP